MNTPTTTTKRLAPRIVPRIALPAISVLAVASVLLLAGWSAPAASAHAGAKRTVTKYLVPSAKASQAVVQIAKQDVRASESYHNSLSPTQTATAFEDSTDPWAKGTPINLTDWLAGLKTTADLSTGSMTSFLPTLAKFVALTGLPTSPTLTNLRDTALNRANPWQAVMTSQPVSEHGTETEFVLVQKITRTGPQLTLVRLSDTTKLGWRVSGQSSTSQLAKLLTPAYVK